MLDREIADNDLSDEELVHQFQAGSNHAFDLLVSRYQSRVYKIVYPYVHDVQEAMDLTQEVFIKIYASLGKFRGDSAFFTWVYRVAINTAKNYLVYSGRRPPLTDIDIDLTEQLTGRTLLRDYNTPEKQLLCDEIEDHIFKVIGHLPEELRQCFLLREIEQFTYDEIAKILGCPVGTVRSRIFRARETVAREIAQFLEE